MLFLLLVHTCCIGEIDQKERIDQLVSLVDLSSIKKLEVKSSSSISHILFIKEVLL